MLGAPSVVKPQGQTRGDPGDGIGGVNHPGIGQMAGAKPDEDPPHPQAAHTKKRDRHRPEGAPFAAQAAR